MPPGRCATRVQPAARSSVRACADRPPTAQNRTTSRSRGTSARPSAVRTLPAASKLVGTAREAAELIADGATVSVMGKVNAQGVYPIERPTRTLSAMLSKSGGVSIEPEVAVVTVKRGNASGKVWLRDLYSNTRNDIALRPGDVILVEEDQRSFTALGALGGQTKVPLGNEQINAIEAVAMVGGLATLLADPKGVFVMRTEPQAVARAVLGRNDIYGDQRMAYVLNLTKPDGMFVARDFVIRDGDTVYVTEAPFVQWQKIMNSILGTASDVGTAESAFR